MLLVRQFAPLTTRPTDPAQHAHPPPARFLSRNHKGSNYGTELAQNKQDLSPQIPKNSLVASARATLVRPITIRVYYGRQGDTAE